MEFSRIITLELPKTSDYDLNICRICLQKNHNLLVSLFDKHKSQKSTIASIVSYVAGVEICKDDFYPKFICNECLSRFHDAAEIKKKCIESDQQLRAQWIDTETFEIKQECVDLDHDYYNQHNFTTVYDDDVEFMNFPSIEPIDIKTEDVEVEFKMEIEESDEIYVPVNCERSLHAIKDKQESDEEYVPSSYKRVVKTNDHQNTPNPYNRTTKRKKREAVPEGNICKFCSKIFMSKYAVKTHLNRCKKNGKNKYRLLSDIYYFCKICGKQYIDKYSFNIHERNCKEIYYYCEICHQTIEWKSNMDKHLKQHSMKGDPPISQCEICDQKLYSRDAIKQHPCLQKNVKCPICDADFAEMRDFIGHCRDHKIKVLNDSVLKCTHPNCPEVFKSAREFYNHVNIHLHSPDVCRICAKYFSDQWHLNIHRSLEHQSPDESAAYICDYCGKRLASTNLLTQHLIMHVNKKIKETKTREELIKRHFCEKCSESFVNKRGHARHEERCREFYYFCDICQQTVKYKSNLDKHAKFHEIRLDPPIKECEFCNQKLYSRDAIKQHPCFENLPAICPICNAEFADVKDFVVHCQEHKVDKILECTQPGCSEVFTNPRKFYNHVKIHNEPGDVCRFCAKYFDDQWKLHLHRSLDHLSPEEGAAYICDYCGIRHTKINLLTQHLMMHVNEKLKETKTKEELIKKYHCKKCLKIYVDKRTYRRHEKRCKEIYYFCEICQQKILYKSNLEDHLKEHEVRLDPSLKDCEFCHQKLYSRNAIKQHPCFKELPTICPICNAEFLEMNDFVTHCKDHKKNRVLECTQHNCSEVFTNPREFFNHVNIHNEPDVCQFCGEYFDDKWQVNIHISTQHANEDFSYICKHCGKRFAHSNRLLIHERTHVNNTAYKPKKSKRELLCDKCSRSFKANINLQRHQLRDHGATGNYLCDLCGIWYILKNDIAIHMKSRHRPKINCHLCSMSFNHEFGLKNHIRMVHVRKTRHRCTTCLKNFKTYWHLVDHIRSHTGDMNYECTVCNKGFIAKAALKEHMRSHTGESPFACEICQKRFRGRISLKKHYVGVHKLKKVPKIADAP